MVSRYKITNKDEPKDINVFALGKQHELGTLYGSFPAFGGFKTFLERIYKDVSGLEDPVVSGHIQQL